MVILAASVVITLSNTGIIEKANEATETTDVKSIQQEAEVVKLLEFGNHLISKNAHEERFNKIILINKLLEHFKGSTKQGDGIVTADGKYNIIVGEDLTIIVTSNSNTKVKKGDLKLNIAYDNSEKTVPVTVYITPTIEGWTAKGESYSSYEEYAEAVLATVKTDAELEQIFVDGQNYWNKESQWGEPNYKDINELMEYWGINFCEGTPITSVEQLCEEYEYENLREFAIDWEYVKPEGYYRSYSEYTEEIFKTTTKTYEQLYMEGTLYWAEVNESSKLNELRNAKTFEEFVSISEGIDNIKSVEELKDYANENWNYKFETAKDFLINWHVVEPEIFALEDGMIAIQCSNGDKQYVMNGETVEFVITAPGDITFTATAYNGRKEAETITIEADLPVFTIEGENGTKSFAYIQGMTWQDWLESDFNTLTTRYEYNSRYNAIYVECELETGHIRCPFETEYGLDEWHLVDKTEIIDGNLDYFIEIIVT